MKTEILVTGGTGFIGSALVGALSGRGYAVRALSRADGEIARCSLDFPPPSHVFHLAARVFVPDSWKSPLDFYETNVLGTVNVLEYCRRKSVPLTFVSSYVYGHPTSLPISESHPLVAVNPYAHSKILAEQACGFYAQTFSLPVTIVRPFNLYGPGQDGRFLIPTLASQLLDPAQAVITVADPLPRRDYIFLGDFVELLLRTIEAPPGVYNAGGGVSWSILDLIQLMAGITGIEKPLHSTGQNRPHEINDVVADITQATRDLSWTPHTSLREGLTAVLAALSQDVRHG
jgi:nucleoside-diphosphate-sugar epimerase